MHPASCNRVENGAPHWARRRVSKAATEREQSTRRVALSAASVALCPSVSVWQKLCVYLLQFCFRQRLAAVAAPAERENLIKA